MNKNSRQIQLREPIVVLTGAGISAESGIPTFRGEGGLWRNHRPQDLATPEAFDRDPELIWEFYSWRREIIDACEPNPAHLTLVEIEQSANEFLLITQNVDGLHFKAGNNRILELHGSVWKLRCVACDHKWTDHRTILSKLPPKCPSCLALARPDVVWFGEMLDPSIMLEAERASQLARTMLVVGTSALVQPANLLPLISKNAGARVIEFNIEPTALTQYIDESYFGPAGKVLPVWWEENQNKFSL